MTEATPPAAGHRLPRLSLPLRPRTLGVVALALVLAACTTRPSATPRPSPSPTATEAASPSATASGTPTATPEPPLSLALPAATDERHVAVSVAPEVPADGDGQIVVTVANLSDQRVTDLVLRWPTALDATLFLAPFKPSEQRIANGGPPLVQPWTKWVVGPGERGEPAGTTSLGWGPLDPSATLTIPILVTRRSAGDVEFDLQVLAGEAILTLEDGTPSELRVSVP